ncbi:prepilin-type N-terminal cleavage/methylation domain-containing protein [Desulfurobacterium pacificum]|uniref:Prepilin-type N-terminal cleavage/methylation domain-containing protein n=1 Tax=Desulfurobacterium pacificum TaxID=240166 RepID=A0ABY1NL12_9BACT|nr:prepilin-type N-terminal cleavage/methylation domain-containing protein [Desulfurobacterium pacificum]SMP12476.1 prepilin-type N-terminal cleavage/methylation domain-containing protein [Desulfurobacterium pacificum]
MRKQQGFTLIELAIVLVIIGIIMGAVLKGKDLIENARIKKVATAVKQWEMYQWAFYDRMGRYAGDQDKSGIIGDNSTTDNAKTDLENAHFINPPDTNAITSGSNTFYVFYGYYNGTDGKDHNALILCASSDCSASFDNDTLPYLTSIDRIVDGSVGTGGNVFCTSSSFAGSSTKWIATLTSNPTLVECYNGTASIKALVYKF